MGWKNLKGTTKVLQQAKSPFIVWTTLVRYSYIHIQCIDVQNFFVVISDKTTIGFVFFL